LSFLLFQVFSTRLTEPRGEASGHPQGERPTRADAKALGRRRKAGAGRPLTAQRARPEALLFEKTDRRNGVRTIQNEDR